jgi:hypothetical protein
MDSIIISLIPTLAMLLLGALLYFTDPGIREARARARRSMCVGCGVYHNRRNACDGSFSAFCTDSCMDSTYVEPNDNSMLLSLADEQLAVHRSQGIEILEDLDTWRIRYAQRVAVLMGLNFETHEAIASLRDA